jgi:hypothetical protein
MATRTATHTHTPTIVREPQLSRPSGVTVPDSKMAREVT